MNTNRELLIIADCDGGNIYSCFITTEQGILLEKLKEIGMIRDDFVYETMELEEIEEA